jgi:hypothetical protein
VAGLWSLVFRVMDLASRGPTDVRPFTEFISDPDFFSFFVAYLAGTAGVLSLTSGEVRRPDRCADLGDDHPSRRQRRGRGRL